MLSKKSQLKNSNQNRNEKGITLVALIITVVVMLILAGVAIAAVVDGDGLFNKARETSEVYENAVREEGDTIQSMINQIDEYLVGKNPPVGEEIIENPINQIVNVNQTYSGGTTGSYNDPIIPKGFKPVENEQDGTITEGAVWGSSEGYKYGLVIQDESGNQFVWVPVDGTTVKFERYDFGKMSSNISSFDDLTEIVPEEITTSVNNNGGFYIARYEAGLPEGEISSSVATNGSVKPVSKQGATVWNSIPWGSINNETTTGNGAVTVARSMYPDDSDSGYGVVSTLIYGVQWDTALKFIGVYNVGEAGYDTYATDSTGMGNYIGTSGRDDIDSYWNSENDNSGPAECGASEGFRQKNIYDMAGNIGEWTMEIYNSDRVVRSGAFGNSGLSTPSSNRVNRSIDDSTAGRRL